MLIAGREARNASHDAQASSDAAVHDMLSGWRKTIRKLQDRRDVDDEVIRDDVALILRHEKTFEKQEKTIADRDETIAKHEETIAEHERTIYQAAEGHEGQRQDHCSAQEPDCSS